MQRREKDEAISIWRSVYWFFTGAFIAFGFLGILSIGLPFLVVGALMLVGGLFLWRGKGFWLMIASAGACGGDRHLAHPTHRTASAPTWRDHREPWAAVIRVQRPAR